MKQRVLIMGAAGRDFHNFNVAFRNNPAYQVVCFTATQIPNIAGRRYPASLAGKRYPKGIPIHPENQLERLIKRHNIDQVIFSYSDVSHATVMHAASRVLATGADFRLLGPKETMLASKKTVIAVTAVRTGCGKSQTTRHIAKRWRSRGKRAVVVRHPMPYGDLAKQAVQRFATHADLDTHRCTIEEREEYEPLIDNGIIVYAGVDYERILRQAEKEADVVIWDGGNNDYPFYRPNLWIALTDPHRPGHELQYYPGEANLRAADIVVINKIKTANKEDTATVRQNIKKANPSARIVEAESVITTTASLRNKRVLVVEDGPTLTHGGMPYGAGTIAAKRDKARIVDPRPYLTGSFKSVFKRFPHLGKILPAMGYGAKQMKELQRVLNAVPCDVIVAGTPIDLRRVLTANKPIIRVNYEFSELRGHLTTPKR